MKRLLLVLTLLLAPVALEAQAADTVYVVYQAQKSPGGAGLLSALLVGSGQAYNGEWGKGIGFLTGAVLFVGMIDSSSAECHSGGQCLIMRMGFAGLAANWTLGIIDAVRSAERLNAAAVQVAPTTGADGRVGLAVSVQWGRAR